MPRSLRAQPEAATRVVVEIGAKAERKVEPRFTRRLMQLELDDVGVPPAEGGRTKLTWSALFYRVLLVEPQTIRVELWERGELYGARTVQVGRGTSQLHSRRIALAAVELARDLRQLRLAERTKPKKSGADVTRAPERASADLLLLSGIRGAGVGPTALVLLGPELGGRLRFDSGAELDLRAAWYFGGLPDAAGSAAVVWRELSFSPGYTGALSKSVGLGMGANVSAAALHLSGLRGVNRDRSSTDTWNARATIDGRLELSLSRNATLALRPEFGATLRHFTVTDRNQSELRVGGVWLGLGITLSIGSRHSLALPRKAH